MESRDPHRAGTAIEGDSRAREGLVGREAELALLERLLDGLPQGRSGAACFWGEPGIGKTALLGEARRRAAARGFRGLSGRAAEFESGVPFAIIVEALERALEELEPVPPGLRADELALLAGVFRVADGSAMAPPSADAEAGQRVLRAMRMLLERLTEKHPLVVTLDDLHWADSASLDLVCRLLHRGLEAPVLLVLAARPAHSEPRLLAAAEEAERHGGAARIELAPLTAEQAKQLLGEGFEPPLREALYLQSGGNPFYLEQLGAAARRCADLPAAADQASVSEEDVPAAVAAAIKGELEALAPDERTVLQAAAVLGEPFDPALLASTAQLSDEGVLVSLDELLAHDLIRSTDSGGGRFRFRHPIVHRAVYQAAGPAWRLAAHARVAVALEKLGAPAITRALHVERSAPIGDQSAVALLTEAGEQALVRAPASAARWFGAAARLLREDESFLEQRLALLARRAAALGSAADVTETRETMRAFLRLSPRSDDPLRVQAAVLAAMLDVLLGRYADARELVVDELRNLPDQDSQQAAELKRVIAFTYVWDADWAAVRRWARASLAADGASVVRVAALSTLAIAEYGFREIEPAKRRTLEAGELYDRLADEELAAQAATSTWLAWAEVLEERFDEASRHLQRATELSRATKQRIVSMGLLVGQGQVLAFKGQITELAEVADALLEEALLSSSSMFLSWAMSLKCVLELRRGDLYAAVRFGERGLSAGTAAASPLAWSARDCLAEALLEIGEPQRCREQLVSSDGALLLPPLPQHEASYYELLTRTELALGQLDCAAEFAERAALVAERLPGLCVPLAQAQRARALVLLERGQPSAAQEQALASLRPAEAAGALVEVARSRILLGKALVAGDRRDRAGEELQQAHGELISCGALRYCDEAAHELRKLGHVVRAAAHAPDGGLIAALTPRELQVIERLAAGKTNRQIAEDLFLSVRTVDRHTARIFEKLGVNSRAAAAIELERARVAGI
ncbi:MAG: hypothetical protein E6G34_12830 [Actinobacteria bacterium]|nr:MAG: hypothetical protein E6G34_12830 [Actinomycetota bacterium]